MGQVRETMGPMDSNGVAAEFSVVAGLEPFAWSQDDAVAYEVAVDTIGMVIACYSGLIASEERRAIPDQDQLQVWENAITRATADEQNLSVRDRAGVDRATAAYAGELRRLSQPADA